MRGVHEYLAMNRGRVSRRALGRLDVKRIGMAAEEMTNREIAQALFVTPKTVEVHLSNAYRKLDIRSRRQLADALTVA